MRVDVRGARIGSRKARLHQRLRIVGALCKCDQSEGARRAPTVPAGSGRQYAPFCRPRQAWSASNVENTARSDRPGQPEQLRADVEFRNRAGMQVENWAILQIGKHFMRIANAVLAITVYSSPFAICLAQGIQASKTPTTASAAQPAAPAVSAVTPAAAPTTPTASSLLQPSLDTVRQALSGLKVERWKRGSVRDEANTDINSIVVDLQQRVPGLLKDADAAPGTLSKSLPVSRHVDALYDVLLRVVEAGRMAAPDDQANQLRNALDNLEKARLALDDSMEQSASSQEKQLVDLRVTVQKQAAFKCPAPPPPPECPKPPVRKLVRRRPAATKTPATTTPGATPQKPSASGATQKPSGAATTTQKPSSTQPKTGP